MKRLGVVLALLALPSIAAGQQGSTLARIRARGALLCGIDRSQAEYSGTDEHGSRADFDRDLCKAVAVAALGAHARIIFTFYADDGTSLNALTAGKADLIASLSLNPGATGIAFTQPILYDATGLMVLRSAGITTPLQLSGKKICFLTETRTEQHLQQWFAEHHADLLPFPFQEQGEQDAAFVTGNCSALAGDFTRLAETRTETGKHAGDFAILPQSLGPDTLALACRADDPQWKLVIAATRDLLIAAEENSATAANRTTSAVKAFLQSYERRGLPLSLEPGWATNVLEAVGNYEELFRRNLGSASPMALARGANALVRDGGQLHEEDRTRPSSAQK